ncbi:PAS domain-containing protein [Geminicoccus roseus]|uniref:PAS domain-containing protein n=1 Tax=Geminicoccus roseus TaxID=404900 RepID=UPI000407454F|nr:PAS domain-containing protein [Geminicoccus roseus]
MRELIADHDWAGSPLSGIGDWPPSLKVMVNLMLGSSFPMLLLWGEHLVPIYNDAYAAIMRDRLPPLGQAWDDFRPEMAPVDRHTFARVLQGQTLTFEDAAHPVMRPALPPFAPLRACYAPSRDEHGKVMGILITVVPPGDFGARRRPPSLPDKSLATFECSLLSGRLVMSPEATEVLGLERRRTIRHVEDHDRLIHPADLEDYRQQFERALSTGEAFQIRYRIIRPSDSNVAWLTKQVIVLRNPDGTAIGLTGAVWQADASPRDRLDPARPQQEGSVSDAGLPLQALLDDVLAAAIEAQGADAGTLHRYEASDLTLRVAASAGFDDNKIRKLLVTPLADSLVTCVRAFLAGDSLIIDSHAPGAARWQDQDIAALLPARGVHALPLADQSGRAIGVLTTYFKGPGLPSGEDQRQLERCAARAAHALRAADRQDQAERRLAALLEGLPHLVWQSRPFGEWSAVSPQWVAFTGLNEQQSLKLRWLNALHPDDRAPALAAWRATAAGQPLDFTCRIWSVREQRYRWFQTRAHPVRDGRGAIVQWIGTSTDVDQLRQLQERQAFLLRELQHRVRNTLAVIRSIARRTAESSSSLQEYSQHLDGRIGAFARVQAAVTRDPGCGIQLESLVAEELLASHAQLGDQARLSGPCIRLQPKAAEILGLAIHELTTNALKHGALSGPAGRVEVTWQVDGDNLVFDWTETGVAYERGSTAEEGFGMSLLKRTLAYELKAAVVLREDPAGVRWNMTIPINERLVVGAISALPEATS